MPVDTLIPAATLETDMTAAVSGGLLMVRRDQPQLGQYLDLRQLNPGSSCKAGRPRKGVRVQQRPISAPCITPSSCRLLAGLPCFKLSSLTSGLSEIQNPSRDYKQMFLHIHGLRFLQGAPGMHPLWIRGGGLLVTALVRMGALHYGKLKMAGGSRPFLRVFQGLTQH